MSATGVEVGIVGANEVAIVNHSRGNVQEVSWIVYVDLACQASPLSAIEEWNDLYWVGKELEKAVPHGSVANISREILCDISIELREGIE